MIAKIKKDGMLWIVAENELEAYALRKWSDENLNGKGMGTCENFMIDSSVGDEMEFIEAEERGH